MRRRACRPVFYPRRMRRAAAIVCVVVCVGCTSHGGRVPASSALHSHTTMSSSGPSAHRPTAGGTNPSARPSASDPPGADDPAVVPSIAGNASTLGRQLVAAERAVRAPGTSRSRLLAAARTAQAAYRRLELHPGWDATVLALVPLSLRATAVANLRARRELRAITSPAPKDLVPAWRIEAPA